MPLYEYQCEKCEAIEEVIQKFSDAPLTTCSKCGGTVRRLVSRSSFHLKGTGWYATDYKKSQTSPKDTAAPATPAVAPAAGESKEAAKPAEAKTAPPAGPAKAGSSDSK